MGCAPSSRSDKIENVQLITTKISFNADQLHNLNTYFRNLVEYKHKTNDDFNTIEATVERLIQRLIMRIGNLDSRFSSMFLVSLNERQRIMQHRYEYLIRLDALSTPANDSDTGATVKVEEDAAAPGFLRLTIPASMAESWSEFLGTGGRLRRDLIKTKLTNLLVFVIKGESACCNSARYSHEINDSNGDNCSLPGQVVDAEVLNQILKQPSYCRIFYGPAHTDGSLPEPTEFKISLVDGVNGIKLRIGLEGLDKVDVEVRLLIGIGISFWSNLADYPRRIPLYHCDALFHYTVAQSGMYAVAVGPHLGVHCEDRSTLWRIRVPAADTILYQHYSSESVVTLTDSVLMEILNQLRCIRPSDLLLKEKARLRVVSRHILRTIHRWSLEWTGPEPMIRWAPNTLSQHILLVLDELIMALKCQNLRCYFHSRYNVMIQCAKDGGFHHDDSYLSDAKVVEHYITLLHQNSFLMKPSNSNPFNIMEEQLIAKWRTVIASLPKGTMNSVGGYSRGQLDYLSLLVKEILRAKKSSLQGTMMNHFQQDDIVSDRILEPIDNLVYLITLIFKQARDQILTNDHVTWKYEKYKILKQKKLRNLTIHFEHSLEFLIDAVRHNGETAYLNLEKETVMTKTLLQWLYFAMEKEKILGPILRQYLTNLFNASHEYAWHVESWKRRRELYNAEMRSLAMFCKLVITREVSPANGIVESFSKGCLWAESVTRMIERSGNSLRLVLVTPRSTSKYKLTFADDKGLNAFAEWSKPWNISNTLRMRRTPYCTMAAFMGFSSELAMIDREQEIKGSPAKHLELRDSSPMTRIVAMSQRSGCQRGPGELIPALISLNKFRIIQEAASVLPQDDRIAMLDMIQRAARESSRRSRRASCPNVTYSHLPRQTYTPRPESDVLDKENSSSSIVRQKHIIDEHQYKLHREIQEMHDTMTRGLVSCPRLTTWDSVSWTSTLNSIDRFRNKNHRAIWETMDPSIWDCTSTSSSFVKCRSDEMINREESPKWNVSSHRRPSDNLDSVDNDRLPSWDILEVALNKKLSKFDNAKLNSFDAMSIDNAIEV